MASYYDLNKPTTANSKDFILNSCDELHFPTEGLYFGELTGGAMSLPALIDLNEVKAFCFLYNNESVRVRVNRILERIAWRLALTVPSNLCDIVLYNGGNPGDNFNTHSRLNNYLTDDRTERVFFDGSREGFSTLLGDIYTSILDRMSAISCAGKRNLVELNESLGRDARMKYRFIILTDFPRHQNIQTMQRLSQIVEAGAKAGVYVLMSWNMEESFDDKCEFSPQSMLNNMELIFPRGEEFGFKNSGHDDVLNRFKLVLDDSAISPIDADVWANHINVQVEEIKKNIRPSALKQDFAGLEKDPYEPVMSELSVTVGLDINDKHPVTVRFNSGDYIHGFILGQSGSGKSVLLNNIITSMMLKYSPEDLMLYLMDFKGVEFNRYRGAKHTKAVLVDNSDSQMTLEVLRELREENKKRVKLWQKDSVSNIDGYNRKHPSERLPQILFVADECQVMFKEAKGGTERVIQQEIADILNTIATQGRSQGIHMLLATQQLDETDISGHILKNLTECFLLMSASNDADKLVPDSGAMTSRQMTGIACYYHKKTFQSQVKTFYAANEELASAIEASQQKAEALPGNGQHYFCGSSIFYLDEYKKQLQKNEYDCPVALVGQNIGVNAGATTIPLRRDYYEHILIFGANRQEQSTGVLMNALISLIWSYNQKNIYCNFVVVDCIPTANSRYKNILNMLASKGLCRLITRRESGSVMKELVEDVKNETANPTVLAIIGNERFIEVRNKMALTSVEKVETPVEEGEFGALSFSMDELHGLDDASEISTDNMTFPQAMMYLLKEGPMQDVHVLMQVDKPANILFTDEYDVEAAKQFRHKVILKSENKNISGLRFSQDIDVEMLSDEEEHMRAFYYPDGDEPILFTPFQIPDEDIMNT